MKNHVAILLIQVVNIYILAATVPDQIKKKLIYMNYMFIFMKSVLSSASYISNGATATFCNFSNF